MDQPKRIADCISPKSWFYMILAGTPLILLLMRPSWKEFLSMLVIDWIAFHVYQRLERAFFVYLYPDASEYFDGIDFQEIAKKTLEEKQALHKSLCRFPLRRARFSYFQSFIKAIPAIAYVTFFWHHSCSNWLQFALFMTIVLLMWWYFFCAIFIESHSLVSGWISQLHEKLDFREVFRRTKPQDFGNAFEFQEKVNLVFMLLFITVIQGIVLYTSFKSVSVARLVLYLFLVSALGGVLFFRIWSLSRRYFMGGLESIFMQMSQLNLRSSPPILPLHSSEILAQFEKTFNFLLDRIEQTEAELKTWVNVQSEKSRYEALGEMSALIAHDLSNPLHVVQFCVSQLHEDRRLIDKENYLEQMLQNINRAVDLIQSLRARLKSSSGLRHGTALIEAHRNVLKILETQILKDAFCNISISFDPVLDHIFLQIDRIDLIQILDNIYRNAANALLKTLGPGVEPLKRIDIAPHSISDADLVLRIRDNGPGLPLETFERITARSAPASVGLGLRLTRSLIEINGGNIALETDRGDTPGCSVLLSLPLAASAEKSAV